MRSARTLSARAPYFRLARILSPSLPLTLRAGLGSRMIAEATVVGFFFAFWWRISSLEKARDGGLLQGVAGGEGRGRRAAAARVACCSRVLSPMPSAVFVAGHVVGRGAAFYTICIAALHRFLATVRRVGGRRVRLRRRRARRA